MLPRPSSNCFVFSLGIMFYIAVTIHRQNKQPRPTPGLSISIIDVERLLCLLANENCSDAYRLFVLS
jgi:hypothetical protein